MISIKRMVGKCMEPVTLASENEVGIDVNEKMVTLYLNDEYYIDIAWQTLLDNLRTVSVDLEE